MEQTEETKNLVSVTIHRRNILGNILGPFKRPSTSTTEAGCSRPSLQQSTHANAKYYSAMFAKPSSRKHKIWEGDGFIIVSGNTVTLKNADGDLLETTSKLTLTNEMLTEMKVFKLGGKEVQILEEVPTDLFSNGNESKVTQEKPVTDVPCQIVNPSRAEFFSKVAGTGNKRIKTEFVDSDDENNREMPLQQISANAKYYSAMFANPSSRKHKIWEEDGFVIISGSTVTMKNADGDILDTNSKFTLTNEMLTEMKVFRLGGKEVQILEEVPTDPFSTRNESKATQGKPVSDGPRQIENSSRAEFFPKVASTGNKRIKTEFVDSDDDNNREMPLQQVSASTKYYAAMFAKPSSRKHKVWEGDGFIIVSGNTVTLKNADGKQLDSNPRLTLTDEMLTEMKVFKLGGKEVQILEEVPTDPFASESNNSPFMDY